MGWFESQIEERRRADQELLENSFAHVADAVLGGRTAERIRDERIITKTAVDEILKYYHMGPVETTEEVNDTGEQLDRCLRPFGLMRRNVELTQGWYKSAYGPLLAFTKEDALPVALLPGMISGYTYLDPKSGKKVKVNARNCALFDTEAICFYRPLPQKQLGIRDLLQYMKSCISMSDVIMMIAASLAVAVVGILVPRITKLLTGPVRGGGQTSVLIGAAISLVCVSLSSQLISSSKELIQLRLDTKTSLGVQSSMMMRLLSLPASFFRKYSAGELKSRSMSVNQLCSVLLGMLLGTGLTSLTSLLYVTQIFSFAPTLVVPSLLIILVTVIVSIITTFVQVRINKERMEYTARESGMSYALITGVQKVKLAGAEKRIFARWQDLFAEGARLTYNPPVFLKLNGVITTGIGLASTILLYYLAVVSRMDQSSYYAFMSAYGMVMGAFTALSGIAISAAQIKPIMDMAEIFLKAEPESAAGKEIVTHISGNIEMEHVSFRYSEDLPYVLDDLSLKIRAGEYVAIVGRTGCGKSTIMRLLLGFEKPEKGAVYYDGKDIGNLDLPSLRRRIGTVTQDAGLFQGDIYSNIVISAPDLTLKDAWEAAEKAGIADDILAMPMGMYTVISEGHGSISGGQRQRIMIARAIAPKPNLLLFDEATSALDNKTQRQVSEALDSMGCTRVIIAHRLSTVRHCDRILVLDGGRIIEEGSYEELIKKEGFFAELVRRQQTES